MDSKIFSRGAELSYKTLTRIPADAKLRPLRDHIIVEPLAHTLSAIIHVIDERKPAQGIVKAIGPGRHHWKYDHQEKGKRTKAWLSKVFTPTDVKVGDLIQIEERPFETFYWGDKLHMIIREGDVCGVLPPGTMERAA
jgi:co-chaperonin GroES (HSP10)